MDSKLTRFSARIRIKEETTYVDHFGNGGNYLKGIVNEHERPAEVMQTVSQIQFRYRLDIIQSDSQKARHRWQCSVVTVLEYAHIEDRVDNRFRRLILREKRSRLIGH